MARCKFCGRGAGRAGERSRIAAALALGLAAMLVHVPSASAAAAISQQQADELTASYMYLTQDFYQKVDTQNVLNGEHTGIVTLLKTEGIALKQ